MKYCGQCGQQVPDEARFCKKCGTNLNEETEVAAASTETEILTAAPAAVQPEEEGPETGSGQPTHSKIPPIPAKPQGRGFPVKTRTIITGIVVVLLLVAGGFFGWSSMGSEAQVQQKLDLAIKYLSENKFEEAILQYNEVLQIDNKNLLAYKGLGKTFTIQGNYHEAEKTYQAGLDLVDDREQLKLSLAGLYMDQGKNHLAEKTYAELIAGDKTFIPAYEGLARVLITRGKQDEAISLLHQCIETNSGNERSYSLLAGIYLQKGDSSQTLDLIARSLKINPNQCSAYSLLEKLFNKDWNKIIEYGSTLMAQDETAGKTLRIYGYYSAGQYARAVEEYLALADKGKLCDKAKAVAALAYLKNNDSKSADQLIGKIDLKASKNPFLYADVARYYLEKGDLKQARSIAMEGISLDDTCLENYLVLIELAKNESSSDAYYSYLLLTRSTDPVAVLEKELNTWDVEAIFSGNENVTPKKQTEENIAGVLEQDKTSVQTSNLSVNTNENFHNTIESSPTLTNELKEEIFEICRNNAWQLGDNLSMNGIEACDVNGDGVKEIIVSLHYTKSVVPYGRLQMLYWDGTSYKSFYLSREYDDLRHANNFVVKKFNNYEKPQIVSWWSGGNKAYLTVLSQVLNGNSVSTIWEEEPTIYGQVKVNDNSISVYSNGNLISNYP